MQSEIKTGKRVAAPTTTLELSDINLAAIDTFMRDDIHGVFAKLRAEAPVSWHQHPDSGSRGFWAVTRYEDIDAILRDTQSFSNKDGIQVMFETDAPRAAANSMIEMDPPRHTKYRRIVAPTFAKRGVAKLEQQVRARVHKIMDELDGRNEVDFVQDFATPLPLGVFYDLMGVPRADQHRMLELADRTFFSADPRLGGDQKGVAEAGEEIQAYGRWLAQTRFKTPSDDLMSELAHAEVDGERLSIDDLGAFFGLLGAAGADTTRASLTYGLEALSNFPDQKALLLEALDARIDSATEEIVRWASPTMHMRRTAMCDTEIAGQPVKAGDKVAVWFMSGNRDETIFDNPYGFDILRQPNPQMGFGMRGPHHCLGAHLARLEIRVAFTELLRRYPGVEATGASARLRSNFINGPYALPAKLHRRRDSRIEVRVRALSMAAEDIRYFELESPDGGPLPEFTPGAHIDVHMGPGLVRQYSLCNASGERYYSIAVKREPESRGGSRAMHENLKQGDILEIEGPKNNFKLQAGAGHYVLVAGGIGITPLKAMAQQLAVNDASFELHYFTRSRDHTAFRDEFGAADLKDKIHFHEGLMPDQVAQVLGERLRVRPPGGELYLCGPKPFMDTVQEAAEQGWPSEAIHLEYFAADQTLLNAPRRRFTVELARSGLEVEVPENETIVGALAAHGIEVDTSCEQGVCGTCVAGVIAGEPDHRDSYLSAAERDAGKKMCLCVSRAKEGSHLVIDL